MATEEKRMIDGSVITVNDYDNPPERYGEDEYYLVNAVVDESTCDYCNQWVGKYVSLAYWSRDADIGHGCKNKNGCRCTLGYMHYPNGVFGWDV